MSRPKSEATLERERDREIRQRRRALIGAERERRRAARAEKARLREIIRNGTFAETPVDLSRRINIFDLTRHDYLCFCRVCHQIKKSRDMKTRDLCEACYYNIEIGGAIDDEAELKKSIGRQPSTGLTGYAGVEGEGNPQHPSPSTSRLNKTKRPEREGMPGRQKTLPFSSLVFVGAAVNSPGQKREV